MTNIDKILKKLKANLKSVRFTDLCTVYDHYTYRVTWSEDDNEYIGLCIEFPSLSWLSDSPESALIGIRDVVSDVVCDMNKNKEKTPSPLANKNYSRKFLIRVPPEIHRTLVIQAAEAGVSLNRLASVMSLM
ncbi:MAG: toxin-antitoxin system HicB family antitoxin [Bacteroidales bacterium]|nr:toxin-antitoxin system HicB family antitoxin [Bacteroidales bacterium]